MIILTDKVTRGLESPVEIVEAYLVIVLLSIEANDIVAKRNKRHVDRFDSAEQVRIDCPCQDDTIDQALLLKNGRQVDLFRGDPRRVVEHRKQDVLFQGGGVGFNALQNAGMKGMEKIAVAEKKANNFRAALEDAAGLSVRTEPQTPDGFVHACTRLPAHLRLELRTREIVPGHFVLEVAYVGNHGVDNVVNYNLNAATVIGPNAKLANNGRPEFLPFNRTAATNLLFAGYSSNYHALQVKFDRRFSGSLATTTAYTFSKGMGYQTGDDGGLSFYINQRRDYARNDFDRTQTFVQSIVYDLPFGKNKRLLPSGPGAAILGGSRVSSLLTVMSGWPIYFTDSSASLFAPDNTQPPNIVAPVQILHGVGPNNLWFSASSFAPAAAGTFGNVGRNYLSGPNFFNLDAALSKAIRFTERYGLDLRLEAFGATNTPQFFFASNGGSASGLTRSSSSFGHITSASGGRVLQLGAKLNF